MNVCGIMGVFRCNKGPEIRTALEDVKFLWPLGHNTASEDRQQAELLVTLYLVKRRMLGEPTQGVWGQGAAKCSYGT